MKNLSSGYRPEIEGLRAVAVVPVVLFHFGVAGVAGGFVGVDIFFVISGFLIGGILWAEFTRSGTIRLGHFFYRRIRRLAPAYFAMAFVTLAFAWVLLLPFDFREFGQDLIAATVYLSNVHFFREAGYFDRAAEQKLLLHTWSLAVEEQFYLFLPLFMVLLARLRRALPAILGVIGIISFLACLWMMARSAPASFYLFPFRAWELMAGVLLAILGHERRLSWQVHPALSWAGLALILGSVLLLKPGDHFPGIYALPPVLGAVLIILNGRDDNPVNRLLCTAPFAFFGLISYSLYLWHWPAITLAHYAMGDALTGWQIAGIGAAVVAVSWVSWRLVETPVRSGSLPGAAVLGGYVTASTACLGLGALFAFSSGLPNRFAPEVRPHIAATRDFNQDWSRCHTPGDGPWAGVEICPIGPEGAPRVLIWGDSHGRAFKEGIETAAYEAGTPGLLIWRGGCPPLLGIRKRESAASPAEDAACAEAAPKVLAGLEGTPSIDTVLLIGRWAYYAEGRGVGADGANRIALLPEDGTAPAGDQHAVFSHAWEVTLDRLGPLAPRIFVLRQVPEIFDYTAREAALALAYGRLSPETLAETMAVADRSDLAARYRPVDALLARLSTERRIALIDTWDTVCDATRCSALAGGTARYFDNNHVTNSTAQAMRGQFAPVFERAGG